MIISLANQKGGVGKTTTCINLAAALAEKKKKILVIDLDPQGNTSTGFGINKQSLETGIYDVLVNELPIQDALQKEIRGNIDICPTNINLAGAVIELVDWEEREYVLKKALEAVKDDYDIVMIDCPPSLNLLTLNALCASDGVLIPVQSEFYALEGLSQLLQTISAVRETYNPKLSIFAALITLVDSRTQLSKQVSEEIRNYLGDKVFKTVIPRNVRLSEAPSHGKTIFEYERWSSGARAYKNVAKEFIHKMEKIEGQKEEE